MVVRAHHAFGQNIMVVGIYMVEEAVHFMEDDKQREGGEIGRDQGKMQLPKTPYLLTHFLQPGLPPSFCCFPVMPHTETPSRGGSFIH